MMPPKKSKSMAPKAEDRENGGNRKTGKPEVVLPLRRNWGRKNLGVAELGILKVRSWCC
jgi:hypothetical protein